MLHILLLILKIIGIVLAVFLGVLIAVLLLGLFVPVRYRIKADGRLGDEEPVRAEIKITWLLHILNIRFSYPKEAYLRVRILFFTIFNSSKIFDSSKPPKPPKNKTRKASVKSRETNEMQAEVKELVSEEEETYRAEPETEPADAAEQSENKGIWNKIKAVWQRIVEIWNRIIGGFKNIEYTIKVFCDRIKKIIGDMGFYMEVLQSELFKQTFRDCKKQLLRVIRSVAPNKWSLKLKAGTGDPASTGQILAVYGILYPVIGKNVLLEADFEKLNAEGSLYMEGSISAITILSAAWKIYRNKNIRKLIKLLKREDA